MPLTRIHRRFFALASVGIAAVIAISAVGFAHPSPASAHSADQQVLLRILADTNRFRVQNGLAPLYRNSAMDSVASAWSGQQASRSSMSHNPSFSVQIPSGWSRAGENVAYGYDPDGSTNGSASVVDAWENSPGHRANLLGDYTDIGLGIAYAANGYPYYTQNFAKYPPSRSALASNPDPQPVAWNGATLDARTGLVMTAEPTAESAVETPIYRFWSPTNSTHFYTASAQERDVILARYPSSIWTYEGIAYQAFTGPKPGTVPLYRFWSPTLHGHFFTANQQERNSILASYPSSVWTYEGVAFWVYPSTDTAQDTEPVFRFWSPSSQHHFYTSSDQERMVLVSSYPAAIWSYENIAFRVPTD